MYAVEDNQVYVNLYLSNKATLKIGRKSVTLSQETRYPWNGDIALTVDKNSAGRFAMKLRIPGWVRNQVVPSDLYTYTDGKRLSYQVKVNGELQEAELGADGYFTVTRQWKKGDKVELHFDMEPRVVKANARVEADRGRVAVERGPLVYCAEWPDNDFDVLSVLLNRQPSFTVTEKPDLLYGLNQIQTPAQTLKYDAEGRLSVQDVTLTLIPYYAWAHRGSGRMAVWLPSDVKAARPAGTVATYKITASHQTSALSSVADGLVPQDENDRTIPYYHWWPKNGSTEWVAYEFPQARKVSSAEVYWFDDAPWGGCRVPRAWSLYYKDNAGQWQPVANPGEYTVRKGDANMVTFDPVTTTAMKLEVVLPEKNSAGVFEWTVR